jgi:UDP-2,3-diacylglucosamine pyrophosphatase LpxH
MKNKMFWCFILILGLALSSGCSGSGAMRTDDSGPAAQSPVVPAPLLGETPGSGGAPGPGGTPGVNATPAEKTQVVVISDLHLGDQRSIDDGYGWFINNEDLLSAFLNDLTARAAVKELVIAGDMFDEWVAPMQYDAFNGFGPDQAGESRFVDSIVAAHPGVINAVKSVIASGIKVTYIPGNHDMLVTEDDINRIFPGIFQQRDAAGLGAYSPEGLPEVIIEHSHRYDFFNAPDMYSNKIPVSPENYTNNPAATLPPGFFVSKIAASHGLEYPSLPAMAAANQFQSGPFLYWAAWKLVMSQIPVPDDPNAKIIKTGIDGYTDVYAINDLIPQTEGLTIKQPLLYKSIEDNWQSRQAANRVNVPISVASGLLVGSVNSWCDLQASTQYFFHDSSKRIVIFGHTHHATLGFRLNTKLQKCLYANSGTWIDKGNPSRSFVVIDPEQQSNGSVNEYVTVYQYTDAHMWEQLYEDSITKD